MLSYASFLHKTDLEVKIAHFQLCIYMANLPACFFAGNEILCCKHSVVKKRNIACRQHKVGS